MAPSSQFELQPPPGDIVGSIAFAPEKPTRLITSSWDKNVYVYEIQDVDEPQGVLVRTIPHQNVVMSVAFGDGDNEAYSCTAGGAVKRIDLETGELTTMSKHEAACRVVVYSRQHSILVSAAWDNTLHFHHTSNGQTMTVPLPAKPYAMSASPTKVVVAMSARLVHIYDLDAAQAALQQQQQQIGTAAAPLRPWQQRESSLKFLTRAVACMPNDAGYATSSIEGRVAVEWFEDTPESQARKYAFKCHRQADGAAGGDLVYPVHALAFHPRWGTFASGGQDGTVALWDAEAKRRMKQYQKFPDSVWCLAFSRDGRYMAIGICPPFETDTKDYTGVGKTKIIVRELGDTEAKGKGSK